MTGASLTAEARQIVLRTRRLLTEQGTWTKGCEARDEEGNPCSYGWETACRWCLHGALLRAAKREGLGDRAAEAACDAVRSVIEARPDFEDGPLVVDPLHTFNDAGDTTRTRVLEVLDAAAAALAAKAGAS